MYLEYTAIALFLSLDQPSSSPSPMCMYVHGLHLSIYPVVCVYSHKPKLQALFFRDRGVLLVGWMNPRTDELAAAAASSCNNSPAAACLANSLHATL